MSYRETRQVFPTAYALEASDVAAMVSRSLQQDFGQERHAVKKIAGGTGAGLKTAENWLGGRCAPDAANLLKLMAMSPVLAGEVRRLTAMEANLDPEFERAMSQAVNLFMRMREQQ